MSQSLGPVRRATRASKRERRRRRRRVRASVGTFAAIGLVLVLAVFLVDRTVRGGKDGDPARERTQQTLLLQLRSADGAAVAGALLAHDPAPHSASMVLLPAQTISDAPGYGSLPFGQVLKLAGVGVSRQAASDLLAGVRIDHDWTLDSSAFGKLVDSLGGVVVDVDRDLVQELAGGVPTTVLREGPEQRLDGQNAVRWATYVARDEDTISALPRFQAVLEGVLAALPAEAPGYTSTLAALGAGSRTSWEPTPLAAFLDGVRDVRTAERLDAAILPVAELETGGGQTTYGIKRDEVTALVERTLAASVPAGRREGDRRVIIENGVGTPGIGASVAAKLTPAGYDIVNARNAARFDHATSVVVVFDSGEVARQRGLEVARLLGLPESAVHVAPANQTVADVVVIVGRDYRR